MKRTSNLTTKQDLVIKDIAEKVRHGKPMKMVESVEKFYETKNRRSANAVLYKNLKRAPFREALIESLVEKKVLGKDSKTEAVLLDGLEAVTEYGGINYEARLRYVQEINKIAGVYAPETKKNLNLSLDMSEEELDKRIIELQDQLEG